MAAKPKATTRAPARTPTPSRLGLTPSRSVPSNPVARKLGNQTDTSSKRNASKRTTKAESKVAVTLSDESRESIMAYLRIRPYLGDDVPTSTPYLDATSNTSVRMTDPNATESHLRYRTSTPSPSLIYTFSHVFQPSTKQSDFFTKTTLPLVKDVLNGQNALLFAYGVTNSGKTYTMQGGSGRGQEGGTAGILPRAIDVIFNSINGLQGDGRFRPVRLHGIELSTPSSTFSPSTSLPIPQDELALAQVFADHLDSTSSSLDIDPTVLQVDRNYEYSVWLSYMEIYNEKIYDLLATVKDPESSVPASHIPRLVGKGTDAAPFLLTRKALPLRASPPGDAPDPDSPITGKYVAGLRQFRVTSAEQAKALIKLGQLNRRVFGTVANSQSSRSHGLVTLRILRGNRGEKDDPTALQISRLTLVDLAGSERTKHAHTSGDRLKEAGSINKSLMVLGQCMEVMRSNQRKVAMSLATNGRSDTRDVKHGLKVIPFRHSKLTEVLGEYFIGDGRVVMILNVNPYDTGYDENSHVMKFAALAKEVHTTPMVAPLHRAPSPTKLPAAGMGHIRGPLRDPEIIPLPYVKRKVTIEVTGKTGKKESETCLEVMEEDEDVIMGEPEDGTEGESDGEGISSLVDALFTEIEELRTKFVESEMRCAIIEAETREEVMREMEERMRSMEKLYERRMMNEVEENELKTDAKIDLLHRSRLAGLSSPVKSKSSAEGKGGFFQEEDVEMHDSLHEDEASRQETLAVSPEESETDDDDDDDQQKEIREFVPEGPPALPLPPGFDGEEERDAEEDITEGEDEESEDQKEIHEGLESDEDDDDSFGEEDWKSSPSPSPPFNSGRRSSRLATRSTLPKEKMFSSTKASAARATSSSSSNRLSALAEDVANISLSSATTADLIDILPPSKLNSPVKKKRQIKKVVASAEEVFKQMGNNEKGRTLGRNRKKTKRP